MPITPTFRPGDPICDALFSGANARMFRDKEYKEGPIEFLPGHFSTDPGVLTFKANLANRLSRDWPASVDDLGRVYGNGVRSNFHGLRHVNGFPMLPATFPISDNRLLRTRENLLNEFKEPWHQLSLRTFVRLTCTGLNPVPLKLRDGSSSMLPYMEKRMPQKQEQCERTLATAKQSSEWMAKGDFVRPWIENACGGAYGTVYRRQSSDAVSVEKGQFVPKVRKVADEEFAVSGGERGKFEPSSKLFGSSVPYKIPNGFFRERNRTAQGGPLGMNAALMPIAQSIRDTMYSRYAYTFHHTTRESMQSDLRKWKFSIAADVGQHDQFWPTFVLDTIVQGMQDAGLQEWWTRLYKVKASLPLYVTDVAPGLGNVLIGDWRKPDLHPGLSSGNAFTDLEGTWVMTWVYFTMLIEHTMPSLIPFMKEASTCAEIWDRFLTGKLSICLKDKSDDALLGWTDDALLPAANKLLELMQKGEQVSPYMKISYENGGAFLGNILLYPESKNFSGMVLVGNANSLVINQFSPEYSVQSKIRDRSKTKRPFPGLAWESLSQVYGSAPAYGAIMEAIEEEWYNVFHESYGSYRSKLLEQDKLNLQRYVDERAIKLSAADLSAIDREILADPDKLQYKWLPSDASQGVVDLLFKGLPLSKVEPFFRSAYNG